MSINTDIRLPAIVRTQGTTVFHRVEITDESFAFIDVAFWFIDRCPTSIDESFTSIDVTFGSIDEGLTSIDVTFFYVDESFGSVDVTFRSIDESKSYVDGCRTLIDEGKSFVDGPKRFIAGPEASVLEEKFSHTDPLPAQTSRQSRRFSADHSISDQKAGPVEAQPWMNFSSAPPNRA